MNEIWLKVKAWAKGIIFAAIFLYAVLFVYNNSGEEVKFWWWFDHTPMTSVFVLAAAAFFAGVICTLLVRTTWGTWNQIQNSRSRVRAEKLERDMADIKAKAAMLQTKSATGNGVPVQVDKLGGSH